MGLVQIAPIVDKGLAELARLKPLRRRATDLPSWTPHGGASNNVSDPNILTD